MEESKLEKNVTNFAKVNGWLTYKFVSPASRGVPDRIYMKDGVMFFIEFKSPEGKLSELQRKRIVDIQFAGFTVHVIDDMELGWSLFK